MVPLRTPGPSSGGLTGTDEHALRDSEDHLARAAADEAAADRARARYRTHPLPSLPPDDQVGPLLASGERVLAVRRSALVDRRQPTPGEQASPGLAGCLYVTSRRLILVGRLTLAYELEVIEEAGLSGERLLLVLRDGHGLAIDVAQPRLLRVELSAARAAAKI